MASSLANDRYPARSTSRTQLRNQHLQIRLHLRVQIRKPKSGPFARPYRRARSQRPKDDIVQPKHHLHRRPRRQPQPCLRFDIATRHAKIQYPSAKQHRSVRYQHLGPAIDGEATMLPAINRIRRPLLQHSPLLDFSVNLVHAPLLYVPLGDQAPFSLLGHRRKPHKLESKTRITKAKGQARKLDPVLLRQRARQPRWQIVTPS
jgi:hypothetical protein